MRVLSALALILFTSPAWCQTASWQKLLDYADLDAETVRAACPNFPAEEPADDFEQRAARWSTDFPDEVDAFFALPAVDRLNVVRSQFGVETDDRRRARVFDHPYLQWIRAAGLTVKDVRAFAPHVPRPDVTGDATGDYRRFERALEDWMTLFPGEVEAMMNYPELVRLNPSYASYITIDNPAGEDAFYLLNPSSEKPVEADFDSGNPDLDRVRYEMYLKAWYYTFDTEEFYRIYEPDALDAYRHAMDSENAGH